MSDLITWVMMAVLTFGVIGIPIILMVLPIINRLIGVITDGDYPEVLTKYNPNQDSFTYKMFGKSFNVHEIFVYGGFPLLSFTLSVIYIGVVIDNYLRHSTSEYTIMVNPFSEGLSVVVLVLLISWVSVLAAKFTYLIGKKVSKVSSALSEHMKDKDAHK